MIKDNHCLKSYENQPSCTGVLRGKGCYLRGLSPQIFLLQCVIFSKNKVHAHVCMHVCMMFQHEWDNYSLHYLISRNSYSNEMT
jgi:hypothetical protein